MFASLSFLESMSTSLKVHIINHLVHYDELHKVGLYILKISILDILLTYNLISLNNYGNVCNNVNIMCVFLKMWLNYQCTSPYFS